MCFCFRHSAVGYLDLRCLSGEESVRVLSASSDENRALCCTLSSNSLIFSSKSLQHEWKFFLFFISLIFSTSILKHITGSRLSSNFFILSSKSPQQKCSYNFFFLQFCDLFFQISKTQQFVSPKPIYSSKSERKIDNKQLEKKQ